MTKHIKCISQLKEINVVGNAESLFSKNYGDKIDEHPTIRFNYIHELKPAQGSRWDIVASSQIPLLNKYVNPQFHTLLWTRWNYTDDKKLPALKYNINRIDVPYEMVDTIRKINKRPTTGLTTLMYLDSLGVKCNIFGFDWKATKTYYNTQHQEKLGNSPHNYNLERKLALELIEKNNWNLYS